MHIAEIAVKRPVGVTVIFMAVVMLGIYAFNKLSVDFLPDIDVPKLIVKTEWPDANARDIEERVTQRIEATLSTLQTVDKITSISRDGISYVTVTFNWGTDMDMAFIQVRSKLDRMQEGLPEYSERPSILRFDPSSTPIMTFVITGDRIENPRSAKDYQEALVELKDVASSIVKRRLEQIDGIAYVAVSGGLEREIKIHLDRGKTSALNIRFEEIESALRRFNVSTPGGTIREGYYQYPLRIEATFANIEEIYQTPVKYTTDGQAILLRDIARIEDGYKERTGYTRLDGKEVITLFLYKEAGANTVDASQKVYTTLYHLYQEYPEFKVLPVFDQAEFIQESIDNVLQSLYLGGLFAFFILFYFLKDFKSPLIIGISIPVSIITTIIFMYFFNINFNIISLGGLALGIGMLVDNSIVVLENIMRYREMGHSLVESAVKGTKEVSLAITASTFTTISVFLPLVTVKGLAGELFYDQSVTISIALTVSLIVSMTLLTMLFSKSENPFARFFAHWQFDTFQLPSIRLKKKSLLRRLFWFLFWIVEIICYSFSFVLYIFIIQYIVRVVRWSIKQFQQFFDSLMAVYERILERALTNRGKVLTVTGFCLVVAALLLRIVPKELVPNVDRKQLVVSAELPSGVNLEATASQISQLDNRLQEVQGVKRVLSSIGITENILDQTYQPGVNKAILDIEIKENHNTLAVAKSIESLASEYSSLSLELSKREAIFEQLFQQQQDIFDVQISGPDLQTLAKISEDIQVAMRKDDAFDNVHSSLKEGGYEYTLELNRENMVRYGITLVELAGFLRNEIQGSIPTQFIDFADKIDIKVVNKNQQRMDINKLQQLGFPITLAKQKVTVPVREFVTVKPAIGYSEIQRVDQSKTVLLSAGLTTTFAKAKSIIEHYLGQMNVPGGYLITIGASQRDMRDNYRNLLLIAVISIALVYSILSAQFESIKVPLVIISAIPLAFIGVLLTLLVTGNTLNIMSLMGAIILVGIVVNDSIVKVDFIHRHYKEHNNLKTAIMEAGKKRFRPIVMTTVTTVCGLLPMALASGSGAELRKPLAWVIVGGITIATMLTLVIIPLLYSFSEGIIDETSKATKKN